MKPATKRKKIKEGTKFDDGKVDLTLLPMDALAQVARVMMFGAAKYERDNWKKMEDANRYRAALLRHLMAEQCGEKTDPESGLPHIAHVACNALFLTWFEITLTPKKGGKG